VTGLLAHPPTQAELERLYHELAQIGGSSVGAPQPWRYQVHSREQLIALSAEMLRYDPRLLSILAQFFLQRWAELDPLALRRQMQPMRWPQALLVVLSFVRRETRDIELRYFCDYVARGWPRVEPSERFFLDADRPASRMAQRGLGRNLAAYARWGFVGSERPTVDPVSKRTAGSYDIQTRRQILQQLAAREEPFTLSDYLAAVDHAISRQQALHDLRSSRELAISGHGRGARWRKRRSQQRTARGGAA
jgi:hypothetical protein